MGIQWWLVGAKDAFIHDMFLVRRTLPTLCCVGRASLVHLHLMRRSTYAHTKWINIFCQFKHIFTTLHYIVSAEHDLPIFLLCEFHCCRSLAANEIVVNFTWSRRPIAKYTYNLFCVRLCVENVAKMKEMQLHAIQI